MYNYTNETALGGWAFFDQLHLALMVIHSFTAIWTVLGNTLVLVATWRERCLHQPNKYFIACLAVADLLVGMFAGPLRVYRMHLDIEYRTMSIHVCRFIMWIDTFSLTVSIRSLTFISFDRYLKISKPLRYKSRMTTSKSLKIIFTIWLISTAFPTYAATMYSGSGRINFCVLDHNKRKLYYTFLAVTAFFLPTVVMLVMYARIFAVVHKRQKMLRNGELGETSHDQNQRTSFLQDLKVIRMLLAVVGAFMLCFGPFFVWVLLVCYHPNFIDWNGSLSYWKGIFITQSLIFTLPYINSLCNPIIYACLDQKYKEAFKNLFQRMICRRNSRRRLPDAIELRALRTT